MTNVVPFRAKRVVQAVRQTPAEPLIVSTIRLAEALLTIQAVDKDSKAVDEALQLFVDTVKRGKTSVDVSSPSLLKYTCYLRQGHEGYTKVTETVSNIRAGRV
jgi:hypothetical protein